MHRKFSVLLVLTLVAAFLGLSLWAPVAGTAQAAVLQTFTFTGGLQTFIVPAGVTTMTSTTIGATGGADADIGGSSERGASAQGTFTVPPGYSVAIVVGGQGVDGSPATTPPANASITPAASRDAAGGVGGTMVTGFDCATLLTPAELDAAAGLQGGTVRTNGRGDQPGPGQVPGVTECGIEIPTVSNWSGAFAVFTGDEALQNFNALWDIDKGAGYASLPGVGAEALIQSNASPGVNAVARGANGIGVQIGVGYDPTSATDQAVKDAVTQILTLVLSRT